MMADFHLVASISGSWNLHARSLSPKAFLIISDTSVFTVISVIISVLFVLIGECNEMQLFTHEI